MVSTQDVINQAMTWIGQGPYVWGGSSHWGNDCSGFVYGVLKELGVPCTRTTAEGFRQQSQIVPSDQVQPGDLVFFENTDPDIFGREAPGPDGKIASHIGFVDVDWPVYMLDSHDRANGAVNYTKLTSAYWTPKLIEVRRFPGILTPATQPNLLESYKNLIGDVLAPEGEIRTALQNALNAESPTNEIQNILNRMDTLWKEYNGQ